MKKVFVVGFENEVLRMFAEAGYESVDKVQDADLVCFTGGADVSPSLYGEANVGSYTNVRRDMTDLFAYHEAKAFNKPCVGICRGGQFLNIMSGGKLWQDVDKHGIHGTHDVLCYFTGKRYKVSSTHHQMMRAGEDALIVAVAKLSTRKTDEIGVHYVPATEDDLEVVFYKKDNNLCFQPHPEHFEKGHECFDYFFHLIDCQLDGSL